MKDWKTAFEQPKPQTVSGSWQDLFKNNTPSDKPDGLGVLPEVPTLPTTFEPNKSFPAAPKWFNVIQPIKQPQEVADDAGEFVIATAGKFDKALAGMFNQLDYVQTSLGDALNQIVVGRETATGIQEFRNKYGIHLDEVDGKPNINSIRPFKAISDAINWAASGSKELPNTVGGQIAGGIASMGPEILAAAVAPEIKTAKFISDMGIKFASKFGSVMGVEGFINGMGSKDKGTTAQKLTTPFIAGVEQYMTGWMYDNMGAMASKLGGKLATKFIPEVKTVAQAHSQMLIGSLGTTTSNALMFGGYGTASEFLETGKSSWKTFNIGFGMGGALGGREVAKGLWAKGMNTFIASDIEIIKRAAESPASSEELNTYTQEKTKAVENNISKNPEGDMASAIIGTNTALLKAVVEEIKVNPQDVIKSIEESTIDPGLKEKLLDKIDQFTAESDPAVVESKPITNKITAIDAQIETLKKNSHLSPIDQELKIKSLAAKREGMVTKVVDIYDKHSKVKPPAEQKVAEEKTAEDFKQARIAEVRAVNMMPEFEAKGEAIATEFGGRFISRLKPVESIVNKASLLGKNVSEIKDIVGGTIIVPSLESFQNLSKRLKKEGYGISNKKLPNKETGWRGVIATKVVDGIGQEIQLHTEDTWKAHQEANQLTKKYRGGIPPEVGSDIVGSKAPTPKPVFPEGTTATTETFGKGGNIIRVKNEAGEVVGRFNYHPVKVGDENYIAGGLLHTDEGYRKKGIGQNLLRQAMDNLPEGVKGIFFKAETIHNHEEVPYIFDKLGKDYDVTTKENGDVFIEPKRGYNVEDQIKVHNENGGSTFTQEGVNLAGVKGKASVSVFPDRTEIVDAVTPEVLNAFKEKNKDILQGGGDKLSIGTWKNGEGKTELDIVATPSRERAIELGKKYNQKAVWDLGKGEEIDTGGTGGGEEFKKIPIDERAEEATATPYQVDMEKSKALYDEAYSGLEDINLEGSPAKTPLEKKMKAMEIPIATQKELNKAWTETKQKLLAGARDESIAIQEQFKSFIDGMQIGKLGIPLKKGMLKIVNKIDANKPASLENAIDYFDKVIGDASFKYEVIATQKVLEGLDKRVSESFLSKKQGVWDKNKVGPGGLPLFDELKSIGKDMTEGDWNKGQEEIRKIFEKHMNEDIPDLSLAEYNQIVRENFKGLLNNTNGAERLQMEGALRDLKDIIKTGKSEAAARNMEMKSFMDEHSAKVFRVLTANGKKPVKTGSMEKANAIEDRLSHILTWYSTSNWPSLMDIFSKWDSDKYMGPGKGSKPNESILSKEMVGAVRDAAESEHRSKDRLYSEFQTAFKETMGLKSDKQARKTEKENSTKLHTITYKDRAGVEKSLTMTRNQATKVWMELQDPSNVKNNEAPSYKMELIGDRMEKVEEHDSYMRDGELTDLGKKVVELVTPELQKWGEWQLDNFYAPYHPRINEVYRRKMGLDMPLGKKYSPRFVAGKYLESMQEQDLLLSQQNIISTTTNGNLISRVDHGQKLALMDVNKVAMNYIDKMEFFINWTDALDLVNSTFVKNQSIRDAITQNFGQMALRTVDATIKDFGRAPRDARYAAGWLNTVRNNLTVASLALKPNVGFSQLSSMPAYVDKIGLINWVKNNPFSDWAGTKKAWDSMTKSDYWSMRYGKRGGWDWTVMERMNEDVKKVGGSTKWQELKNQSMFITKYGDLMSVVSGGMPVYKYYYDKVLRETGSEKLAETVALREWGDITDKSQQSGHVYDLSQVQRDPILKMATMYRTASMQYHRNVTEAFRNGLLHTFDLTAKRGSYAHNLKTLAMYHIILPSLYQFAANGFQWDKEEQRRAAIIGNFNGVFVAGDILTGLMNSVRGLPWDYQFSPLEQIVVTGKKATVHATAFAKALSDEVDHVDYSQLGKAAWDAAQVLGAVTGTPVNAVENKISAIDDVIQGKTKHPVGRIIGWSEAAMSGNMEDIRDNETIVDINGFTKRKVEEPLPPVGGHKPLPTQTKKPLPGSKGKPLPVQKPKPLPKK